MARWKSGKARTFGAGLAIGLAWAMCLTALGAAGITQLILIKKLPIENSGYGVLLILLLSTVIGTEISIREIQRRQLQTSAVFGLLYTVILILISTICFHGSWKGNGATILLVLGVCIAVGLIHIGENSGNHRKRSVELLKYTKKKYR